MKRFVVFGVIGLFGCGGIDAPLDLPLPFPFEGDPPAAVEQPADDTSTEEELWVPPHALARSTTGVDQESQNGTSLCETLGATGCAPSSNKADIAWELSELHTDTYFMGRTSDGSGFFINDHQTPNDGDWKGGPPLGRVLRIDLTDPSAPSEVHSAIGMGKRPLFHGRHFVGSRSQGSWSEYSTELVRLDGVQSTVVPFELEARVAGLHQQAGVTFSGEGVRWVEGASPTAFAWTSSAGRAWIGVLSFEALDFIRHRSWPGPIVHAVADEAGTLFLTSTLADDAKPRLSALQPDLQTAWTRATDGAVLAAYSGTIVLDDGEVLDSSSGSTRFWMATEPQTAFITPTRVIGVRACGEECTRVVIHDRTSGSLLADRMVGAPFELASPVVTDRDSVVIIETVDRYDLGSIPHVARPNQVHFFEVDEAGLRGPFSWFIHTATGNGFMLFDETIVARIERYRQNSSHQWFEYVGIRAPGLRPAQAGWVTSTGNHAGGFAPE